MPVIIVKILAGIGAVVIVIVVVAVLNGIFGGTSVSVAADAALPTEVCNKVLSISGDTQTVTETRRFGPHRNWVTARSELAADLRTEAKSEAKDSLKGNFDYIECPEECPTLTRANNIQYKTTASIIGSDGWGWKRYDGSADSQASDTFTCGP